MCRVWRAEVSQTNWAGRMVTARHRPPYDLSVVELESSNVAGLDDTWRKPARCSSLETFEDLNWHLPKCVQVRVATQSNITLHRSSVETYKCSYASLSTA